MTRRVLEIAVPEVRLQRPRVDAVLSSLTLQTCRRICACALILRLASKLAQAKWDSVSSQIQHLTQLRSPPTPMLSRAPGACASALGVPCTLSLHCPDCDRIVPVRSHYWAGTSKCSICKGDVMLTMLIHTSKFRTMRTFGKALCCRRTAHCSATTRRPKAPTKI